MFYILVAGLVGDLSDAVVGKGQKILCLPDSAVNHIIHAGDAEFLLVEQMEVSRAHMEPVCHFRHVPRKLGGVNDLPAQGQQVVIVGRGRMVQHIALELKKKDAQKLGDDQAVWLYGGVGAGSASFGQTAGIGKVGALGLRKARALPDQQLEEAVAIGRIRYEKGPGRLRKAADEGLVGSETYPVVPIGLPAGPVPDFVPGRVKDGAVGRIFLHAPVHPESGGGGGDQ